MFFKKKPKPKELTAPEKILQALRILEGIGIEVRDLYASKEFVEKAYLGRSAIDAAKGDGCALLSVDTEFAYWLDKEHLTRKERVEKGVGFEGMMFGVNFRRMDK